MWDMMAVGYRLSAVGKKAWRIADGWRPRAFICFSCFSSFSNGVRCIIDVDQGGAAGPAMAAAKELNSYKMSVVRCPLSVVSLPRTTDYGPRTNSQSQIGPGGLAANGGGADDEGQRAAGLGGELQAAESAFVVARLAEGRLPVSGRAERKPQALAAIHPYRGDGRRAEGLHGGPQGVAGAVRPDQDQAIEVNTPNSGGRRIERARGIDDDQGAAISAGLARGEEAEGVGK
jgi:hypothetical protein